LKQKAVCDDENNYGVEREQLIKYIQHLIDSRVLEDHVYNEVLSKLRNAYFQIQRLEKNY
jgi:hypothetical protein